MDEISLSFHVIQLIASLVCAVIVGAVGWGIKQTTGRLTDKIHSVQSELAEHKDECSKVNKEVLDTRVTMIEGEITRIRRFARWVHNSLTIIATKSDIQLSGRPDGDDN